MPGRPWTDAHPFGTLLFDLEVDPGQERPFLDTAVEEKMITQMLQLMKENDSPTEQYTRLGLEKRKEVA